MHDREMLATMKQLGWKATETKAPDGYKWRDFIRNNLHDGPFIVNVPRHYVATSTGFVLDTHTKGKPVPVENFFELSKRKGFRQDGVVARGNGFYFKMKKVTVQPYGPGTAIKKWWKFTR